MDIGNFVFPPPEERNGLDFADLEAARPEVTAVPEAISSTPANGSELADPERIPQPIALAPESVSSTPAAVLGSKMLAVPP
jgi:hypothetical protein